MDAEAVVSVFEALGQRSRLDVFRRLVALAPAGAFPGELAASLGLPAATLSFHLKALSQAGLVRALPQGRQIEYRAEPGAIDALIAFLVEHCGGAGDPPPLGSTLAGSAARSTAQGPYRVLFVCTRNSARSQIAESIANQLGHGRLLAFSAGSDPAEAMHPGARALLQSAGFKVQGLQPKHWDRFAGEGAPEFDFIITLCDRAASEPCPVWQGHPATAHWSIPDPALHAEGSETARLAFIDVMARLQQRIALLLALRDEALDTLARQTRLDQITQAIP
jgi:protein-tyrosine-phosphatase/DNA-binding transcriptional ArsR family regulator